MARQAEVTDEQLAEAARQMLVEGSLSTKGLYTRCKALGKLDYNRVGPAVRAVRREADEARNGAAMLDSKTGASESEAAPVPDEIRDSVLRVLSLVGKHINDIQRGEMSRARLQEEALRADHAREVDELRRERDEVQADSREIAEELNRIEGELREARARIEELENAATATGVEHNNALLEAKQERQRVETLLEGAITAERNALEDRMQAEVARQAAESQLEQAKRVLEDQREGIAKTEAKMADLTRELVDAKRDRDVALAHVEAAKKRADTAEEREKAAIQRLERSDSKPRSTRGRKQKAVPATE